MTTKTIISNDEAQAASIDDLCQKLEIDTDMSAELKDGNYAGLPTEEALRRLSVYGENNITQEESSLWSKILGAVWGPIPWMIEIAAILSLCIGHYVDFTVITFLLVFNTALEFWNDYKASNALDALKNQLALKSNTLRDGKWTEMEASRLVPGDLVRLRLGDIVPADVKLVQGQYLSIDQAALTGESLPVAKEMGDTAYSGSIVKQGEMDALVTATGANTFFGRTAKLVASAGTTSHLQQTVMHIGNFLIVVAVSLSILLTAVQLARGDSFLELLQFILILVIASIPVAMPAVLSVTMALGTLELSKEKAIASRLQAVEELAGVDILCSDKTGTLTKNQLTIGDPVLLNSDDADHCIFAAALASKSEDHDAIDSAIVEKLTDPSRLHAYHEEEFKPFDPITKRTESTRMSPDGKRSFYTKGAPQIVLDMCDLTADERTKMDETVLKLARRGFRTLGVAESDDGHNWRFLGILPMFDPPRDDSAETIARAKNYGLSVKMVTGDHAAIGAEISGRLGMGTHLIAASEIFDADTDPDHLDEKLANKIEKADGFAQVFPEHKYAIVKSLQEKGHYVAMTGDGVNDAPALKQADVGIAVEGATDAARAAADLILTDSGLSAVVRAIETSRMIFHRMISYVTYRIAMTIDIMFFVVLSTLFFNFQPLSALMIVMLCLLDDIPVMTIAYDKTTISPKPSRFKLPWLIGLSSLLGVLSVIETFGLLAVAWGAMTEPTWIEWLKTEFAFTMDKSHIQSMMFLQLVAGGHFLLFVTRSMEPLHKRPFPSWQLFSAIVGTQILGIVLCGFGFLVPQLPWSLIAVVYIYNLMWMFMLDFAKIGAIEYFIGQPKQKHHKRFASIMNRPLHSHPS
jgi:H+-transporting ATPase